MSGFFIYYYHATTAYHDSSSPNNTNATATASSLVNLPTEATPGTPLPLPFTTLDAVQLVHLPAMTRLTKLELSFCQNGYESECPYILLNYCNLRASAIRLCGIL